MIQHHIPLAAHLASNAAKTRAWVAEDPANRFATHYVEDVAFWNEQGIFTIEQFKRSELETSVWELYKDVYGISPRWMDFSSMTTQELGDYEDSLVSSLKDQMEMEKHIEAYDKAWQAHEDSLKIEGEPYWEDGHWKVA